MQGVSQEQAAIVSGTMRGFLAHLARCRFAPHYVGDRPVRATPVTLVLAGPPVEEDVALLDDAMIAAAEDQALAILVFPELRTGDDIAKLINVLARAERWQVTLPARGEHPFDDTLVGIWWTTPAGDITSVMGLAPLGEMPVTRRAPHVALVAWGGSHSNEHTPPKRREGEVGLTSMPVPDALRSAEKYEEAWKRTTQDVRTATSYPRDGAARPHLAFSLAAGLRDQIHANAKCDKRGRPTRA